MAILRKEFVKEAVGYPRELQIDASGKLIPNPAIYDVLCDQIADLVADDTLAVGSMAYVREEADHVQVKVADNGVAADWGALSNVGASDDAEEAENA